MSEDISGRLKRVRERVTRAADRAGRRPEEITLIAVTKTFDSNTVRLAVDAGLSDFGENRVQEAARKAGEINSGDLTWHLIGHLQSNKARLAASTFQVIHTVDGARLAGRLNAAAAELNRRIRVLAQVDFTGYEVRAGASGSELESTVKALDAADFLDFRGLMTLPPFHDEPERARPYFQRLRRKLEELNRGRESDRKLVDLSMGMSHDFEIAIEEGATLVRVGTAIFGPRS